MGDNMHKVNKYHVDYLILIPLIMFSIISIITIYSASNLLPIYMNSIVFKQIIWYILGFIVAYSIMFIGNKFIYNNIWFIYVIGIISLICLLLFAKPINEAKCWFTLPFNIGNIQPSEFMKIILIFTLSRVINDFNQKYSSPTLKEEFYFLLKVGVIVFIPSFLTFLQPDTGVVLIYLLITIFMLFSSGIRYRWFIFLFSGLFVCIILILGLYFINNDLFIKLLGTNFFLRIDRLLDWKKKEGYQLENGLIAIGSGGLLGFGINKTPLYFPEPQTDFIFAVFANNFGFIGDIFLLSLIVIFDIRLVTIVLKSKNNVNKYIMAGIIGMLIYQQFQNIGMTLGIMPITGITLPFISYGGSSLISYMIMAGVIFNISNETIKY